MTVHIPYPFEGRAELVAAAWDETKHPREAKGAKGGGRFTVLYRSIPAPLSGPSQFGPGDPGWDDPVAQVEANLVDWPGLGHTWGTEAVATHYSTEGSMTVGVEFPKDAGVEEQNGVVIPAGVPGRLVSMTVHTADGPVPLDVPDDVTVHAAKPDLSFEGGPSTRNPKVMRIGKDGDVRKFPMMEMVAKDAGGAEVGKLTYGHDPDRNILAIARMDVVEEHRRKGVGTELLNRARGLHPGAEVDPGLLVSPEGEAWWGAVGDRLQASAVPSVDQYNRTSKKAVRKLEAHVPELQRVYEAEFRAGMDWAADQLTKLTAAAPEPDGIVDPEVAKKIAEATKKARRKALLDFLENLGINLTLANPMVEKLVFDLGRFAGRLMVPGLKEAVGDSLKRSYEMGLSVPDAAEQLREVGVQQAPWRAEMMARTDLNGLANGGSLAGAQLIYPDGTVAKRWLSAHDDRVRPDHVEADGQTVPLEQAFQVGDALLQHPGDPTGPDSETCNCRCTQIYVPLEQALAAGAWDPAKHPHRPAGTSQGGQFAPVTGDVELAGLMSPNAHGQSINVFWDPDGYEPGKGDWKLRPEGERRDFRPDEPHIYADGWGGEVVDTSPPNPKVAGLSNSIKMWIVGKGKDAFPWWREMRAQYAEDMGLPIPADTETSSDYEHGSYTPTDADVQAATAALIEGLNAASAAQPALWRGMGGEDTPGWSSVVAQAKPGDTLNMLPASWSRDYSDAMSYAHGGDTPGLLLYAVPGSKGVADKAQNLSDDEVITAGDFEVVENRVVEVPVRSFLPEERGDGHTRKYRVVTVRQRHGEPVLTATAWIESEHPRDPGGEGGGQFVDKSGDLFGGKLRTITEAMNTPEFLARRERDLPKTWGWITELEAETGEKLDYGDFKIGQADLGHGRRGTIVMDRYARSVWEPAEPADRPARDRQGRAYNMPSWNKQWRARARKWIELQQQVQAAGWVAEAHPRHPKGTHQGGKFRTAQDVVDLAEKSGVRMGVSEFPDALALNMIASEHHGEGQASKALDDLGDYADSVGKPVFLTPEAVGEGGLSTAQLEKWYRRHGFETFKRGDGRRQMHTTKLIREPVTAAGFNPALHPHRPEGPGGGQWAEKGGGPAGGSSALGEAPAAEETPSEYWRQHTPAWTESIRDWSDFTKADVLAGKVPGVVADDTIREGVAGHARDLDIKVKTDSDAAFPNGKLGTYLLSHEAGHHIANEIQRTEGQMSIPELEPYRDTSTRVDYKSPFGDEFSPSYTNEPGEILSDAYAELLHGGLERAREDGDAPKVALLERVARTAKVVGAPSERTWRSVGKQVGGRWEYETVRASAMWDESAHPRDPGGEGGGEFIAKGTTAPGGRALPKRPKLIPAEALKEELEEMWYGDPDGERLLSHWGQWDEWETKEMLNRLNKELKEPPGSGLLSVQYSKEIGRSLAKPRGQARTLRGQLDRVDLLNEIEMHGLDPEAYASELWPEKAEPKPKALNPKDQGVPDIYLNPETGKFKPGFDAKLKSDLVNSALDNHPTRMVTVRQEPTEYLKLQVADHWRSQNPAEAVERQWTNDQLWPLASADPQLPYDLRKEINRTVGSHQARQSTLLHRFDHDEAVRILEERGWGKYLDDAQAKLKVGGRILSRSPEEQKMIADAQKNWGDALTVRGIEYSRPTTYATTVGTFGPTLSKRLVDQGVTVHVGTGYSTDQDQLQYLNGQGNMSSKGWGNNKLDKAGGFYTNGERKAAVGTAGGDGSVNVTAHEIGHAIGHTLAIDTHPKLDEWHGLLYPKLDPYYQQGKKHSQQGRKELWAEGVAVVQERKRRAALGMEPDRYHGITKRSGLMDPEAEEYYAWVESILTKLEAGENAR